MIKSTISRTPDDSKPDRVILYTLMGVLAYVLLGAAVARGWAPPKQKSEPAVRIRLASLGYQSPPQDVLLMNYSTLALQFVDSEHLLLTFNARGLLRRLPNDPPEDNDQNVTALLLDAPRSAGSESGKLLAWTEWRLHDHAQYLWRLGQGRLLLRQGLELRILAPLEHLGTSQPLSSRLLMTLPNPPVSIQISPEGKLMVLQMESRPGTADDSVALKMQVGASLLEKTYDIQFVDLASEAKSADELTYRIGGEQRSAYPLDIPILPAGYLDLSKVGLDRWHVTFGPAVAGGKRSDLFDVVSNCRPGLQFISDDEFVIGGCQRDPGKFSRGGYTLDGKELWRYDFPEPDGLETLKLSDSGNRFALGRILTSYPLSPGQPLSPDLATAQDIRVYEGRSGKQVLRVQASPMQADGRNYALSPDGSRLAVVADGDIEVFNLPPTEK